MQRHRLGHRTRCHQPRLEHRPPNLSRLGIRQHYGTLTNILELTHIAGPLVRTHEPDRIVIDPNSSATITRGDFGTSFFDGREAWDIVTERLPKTLLLGGTTFVVSVIAGVALGAIAALKRGTLWDRGIMTAAVASFSMPSYFLALLLILFFSLKMRWLPTAGASTWQHLILPATTLGLTLAGSIARFTRSAMLEVLRQSYMRTARAKGASRRRQIAWHALPNAAIPTVTVIGFQLGWLIGGSVVIETVFAWPGAGRLFITAVGVRDFAVVQLFILMVASTVIIVNLLVDILYGVLDPRISVTGGSK